MSQLERLKESRKNGKTPPQKPTKGNSVFFNFHPTKEQKDRLRVMKFDSESFWSLMETYFGRNCSLSIMQKAENSSFCVTLRERGSDWQAMPALAVWHSELTSCFLGLQLALSEQFSEFPYEIGGEEFLDEW